MTRRFDVIGFDADDTLWHSEDSFQRVEQRFVELITPFAPTGVDVAGALAAFERDRVPITGYGVKAYTLSMVQAAIGITSGAVPSAVVGEVLEIGLAMLTEPVRLLAHVPEVLADLGRDHRLVLITKGDLVHQDRKVRTSGLAHHFEKIEIVLEKDADVYRRVLIDLDVAPPAFCMVGNSVRSDILPVLSLGAHAVHVPYPLIWDHELVDHDEQLDELTSIAELPVRIRGHEA